GARLGLPTFAEVNPLLPKSVLRTLPPWSVTAFPMLNTSAPAVTAAFWAMIEFWTARVPVPTSATPPASRPARSPSVRSQPGPRAGGGAARPPAPPPAAAGGGLGGKEGVVDDRRAGAAGDRARAKRVDRPAGAARLVGEECGQGDQELRPAEVDAAAGLRGDI